MDRYQIREDDTGILEEKTNLECLVGQLNWIASMTCPSNHND